MSVCILLKKKTNNQENPSVNRVTASVRTDSHPGHVLFLHFLSALSDLFLPPSDLFYKKVTFWNREIHNTALRRAVKRSAFTEKECATSRRCARGWRSGGGGGGGAGGGVL